MAFQKEKRNTLQSAEVELWKTWKKDPSDANLIPLIESLKPLVMGRVHEFRGANLPPSATEGFALGHLMKAINTYDPAKGASLATHATWQLKKTRSDVIKYQNVGRIPDGRAYNIARFQEAKKELTERMGREPDTQTLAEHLKWSLSETARMNAEIRSDLISSLNPEPDRLPEMYTNREREVLRYIHQDLPPLEKSVFEHTLGLYGKERLSAGQIAKTLGISGPKVARIRRKIDMAMADRGV